MAELSLDCRPSFIPSSITDFLHHLSSIRSEPDKLSRIHDYISRLEDEMRKIDAFKRELPLSLLLLNDAIMALKAESVQYKKPVLEEFIPLKKSCENDKAEPRKDKDSREKMSWMSSVQLWNCESTPNDDDEANHKQSELKMRSPEDGNSSVTDDPFQSCKTMMNLGNSFSAFKGFSKAGGLSLHTPLVAKLREDTVTSPFNASQSNVKTLSLQQQQQQQALRKQRRCWSPDLHRRFVDALQQLGGSQVATPKQIRELMQVDGLTNDEVKSHLQKYRLHTRRLPNSQNQAGNQPSVGLGNLWSSQEQYGESSKPSGSPQGPLHLGGSSRGTSLTAGDSMEDEEDVKSESHSWKNHVHSSGKIDV